MSDIPIARQKKPRKAACAERRRRAVELVLSGSTYQQAADALGYANRGTVHRLVQQTLARHEAEKVEDLRDLEVARLDRLLSAYFGHALEGDMKAADLVLKISAQRMKLLQLDNLRDAPSGTASPILVGGTKEEFIAALKAGREQHEGPA